MLVLKKEAKVKDKVLTIELPSEFNEQDVEIIIRLNSLGSSIVKTLSFTFTSFFKTNIFILLLFKSTKN